ncbi:MAG: universal stress protein [Betaproteobacteria bacterium]|nr:universal stress protein [Betaproteobacteria bacterium]
MEKGECADFLGGSSLSADARARILVVIESGSIATSLTRFVREQDVDLVLLGTHGRSALMNVLLGSTATELLDWLPCDTMIVRDPRATS